MPIYRWWCQKCDAVKENIQKFEDKPPKCCGKPMTRLPSVFNNTFGWRLTQASHLPYHKDDVERNI